LISYTNFTCLPPTDEKQDQIDAISEEMHHLDQETAKAQDRKGTARGTDRPGITALRKEAVVLEEQVEFNPFGI
jgi:hypothetical protein